MTLVTVLAVVALATAAIALFFAGLQFQTSQGKSRKQASPLPLVRGEVLHDPRSMLQISLRFLRSRLEERSSDGDRAMLQIVNMLSSSPLLVGAAVLTDAQLALVEASPSVSAVWIVSKNEEIEFEDLGSEPSFANIVVENRARGVVYRYLVRDTVEARARMTIMSRYGLNVRFLSNRFWSEFLSFADGLIVFEHSGDPARAYYLLPGQPRPRSWIDLGVEMSAARLREASIMWDAGLEPIIEVDR
jgi:hypothetical protein